MPRRTPSQMVFVEDYLGCYSHPYYIYCQLTHFSLSSLIVGWGIEDKKAAPCTCSVRANHCIPMDKGIFYFEVEVLDCAVDYYSAVAVGLVQEVSALGVLCGWLRGNRGYHSDDGSILTDSEVVAQAPLYGPGQVVGVTFDPSGKTLRFTLDGAPVGDVVENVVGQLYPAVSFQGQLNAVSVRVNFGVKDGNGLPFKHKPVMP
ncbi:hypothetical protein MAPG_00954 [Magnaporthiopsis poae ATCC 64411]|uniref:B30.2/SPRY domain-containing protein n=1 Tax=Magnaporthiopsis poae (strain ATCC 64411 / 73-15) TaxID=644358 RepID=A0A0C4DME8_MAGP6|nr:hypothetical protein MAPG_00954 [Magnaporthiopsis poae ATCC 64411]